MVELCTNIIRDEKLKTGKRGQKAELTGRIPFRRLQSAADCCAIEKEKEYVQQGPSEH